jgi:acetyl esterase/lipase
MPVALLVTGLVVLAATANAWRPTRLRIFVLPSFFFSMLVIEQAAWWLVADAALTIGLAAAGGVHGAAGWAGLAMLAASAVALAALVAANARTSATLRAAGAPAGSPVPFPRAHVLCPPLAWWPRRVRRQRNIVFAEVAGERLRLDIYVHNGGAAAPPGPWPPAGPAAPDGDKQPGRPGILNLHGGSWTFGDNRDQGVPLLNHMAANGWLGINANYRLSPKVAFPAHLQDVKRAIAWYREHAPRFGADPDFLCLTGSSAGGHLATLAALTADDPEYQPGFEDVDTAVRAVVPWYAVYDFTNRLGTWAAHEMRALERDVMQRRRADAAAQFVRASPLDRLRPDAPPFLVLHGAIDTIAPVAETREFVTRLRAVSTQPVLYAELDRAQHGFDILPSPRTARAAEAVERFLADVHRQYLARRRADRMA